MALLKHTAVPYSDKQFAVPLNEPPNMKVTPTSYQASTGTASSYNPATAKAASYKPATMSAASYAAKTGEASSYKPTTYNADQREVQDSQVVESRLNNLIEKNSDYMKRAKTEGLQIANSRGLLNTDFAVGAAHGAAIDRALPIAQQDASTYTNQQLANQNYSNTARRDNASFTNESDRFNAGNKQQMTIANMDAENSAGQFNAGNKQQANFANMNSYNDAGRFNAGNQQQTNLANMDSTNQANQYNANNSQNMTLANMSAQDQAGQFNASAANRAGEFNATTAFNQWSQQDQQRHAVVMENLTTENKDRLIRVEMDYKATMENQKNSSDAYREAIAQMGSALSNGELSGEQQSNAVKTITDQLDKFLDFNSGFMGDANPVNSNNSDPVSSANQNYAEQSEKRKAENVISNQQREATAKAAAIAEKTAAIAKENNKKESAARNHQTMSLLKRLR